MANGRGFGLFHRKCDDQINNVTCDTIMADSLCFIIVVKTKISFDMVVSNLILYVHSCSTLQYTDKPQPKWPNSGDLTFFHRKCDEKNKNCQKGDKLRGVFKTSTVDLYGCTGMNDH